MEQLVPLISRSFVHGSAYGAKIRLPHAAVMTVLFGRGSAMDRLRRIAGVTWTHARNLAYFAIIYKLGLGILRTLASKRESGAASVLGRPAAGWHPLVAGAAAAACVWSKYSSVNYQVLLYLASRVVVALLERLAKQGVAPFCNLRRETVFSASSVVVWALVMWLWEMDSGSMQRSLALSMEEIYGRIDAADGQRWLPTAAVAGVAAFVLVDAASRQGVWKALAGMLAISASKMSGTRPSEPRVAP